MICRTTFHWLHADWEIWANAQSEPTKVDTSISSSIEAHKDKLDGNDDEPNDRNDWIDSVAYEKWKGTEKKSRRKKECQEEI